MYVQLDDGGDARADAVDGLAHVVAGVPAFGFPHAQRSVLQDLHVRVADDHLEVASGLRTCTRNELRNNMNHVHVRVTEHYHTVHIGILWTAHFQELDSFMTLFGLIMYSFLICILCVCMFSPFLNSLYLSFPFTLPSFLTW